MRFITDIPCKQNEQHLSANKHHSLIFKHANGHQLARFPAPKGGWTRWDLWQVRQQLLLTVMQQDASAHLGDLLLGRSALKE